MKELKLEIRIDEEGRLHLDAHGYEGEACLETIGRLLEDLGLKDLAEVQRKPQAQRGRRRVLARPTVRTGRRKP